MSLTTGVERGAPSSYRPDISHDQQQKREAGVELVCELLHVKTNCAVTMVPHTEIAVERSSGAIEAWTVCARIDTNSFLACSFNGGTLKAWKLLAREDVDALNPGFTEPRGGSWVRPETLRSKPPESVDAPVMPAREVQDYSHFHSTDGRSALIQLVAPRVVALLDSRYPLTIDAAADREAKGIMDRELARASLAYARSIGRTLKGHFSELEIVERVGSVYSELFKDLSHCVQKAFIEQRIAESHRHGSILHTAFDTLGRYIGSELQNRARGPFGTDRSLKPEAFQTLIEAQIQKVDRSYPGFSQARDVMGAQSFTRQLSFSLGRYADPTSMPAWAAWSIRSSQPVDRKMQ